MTNEKKRKKRKNKRKIKVGAHHPHNSRCLAAKRLDVATVELRVGDAALGQGDIAIVAWARLCVCFVCTFRESAYCKWSVFFNFYPLRRRNIFSKKNCMGVLKIIQIKCRNNKNNKRKIIN